MQGSSATSTVVSPSLNEPTQSDGISAVVNRKLPPLVVCATTTPSHVTRVTPAA